MEIYSSLVGDYLCLDILSKKPLAHHFHHILHAKAEAIFVYSIQKSDGMPLIIQGG